jgi:hypothetical protein
MTKTWFFLLIFFISIAIAEPNNDSNSETTTPDTNGEKTEATNKTQAPVSSVNTPDSFEPSETLSQDIPTAFPVDI